MRVTKTIREFIEKEVYNRLKPKYSADEIEAKRQADTKYEFVQACQKAAEDAYNAYFEEHFHEISDFCEDSRGKRYASYLYSTPVTIKDSMFTNNVHNWNSRMRAEGKGIIDNIIVDLELGGTKADLMEMLNKI